MFFNSKSRKHSPLLLADFPIPRDAEPLRAFIAGGPGSGKSSLLKKLLRSMMERFIGFISVDVGGDLPAFVKSFAPPGYALVNLDPYREGGVAPDYAELL